MKVSDDKIVNIKFKRLTSLTQLENNIVLEVDTL